MKHNRLAIAIAWQRFGHGSAQKDTALSYRPTDHKQKQAEAFEESIDGYKFGYLYWDTPVKILKMEDARSNTENSFRPMW